MNYNINETMQNNSNVIKVRGAKENNLKNLNADIPKNKLVVITGTSGSGKSSFAFETIYAEGQRLYVDSLSNYAKQFLDLQNKPDVESITGLSPAIAIVQRTISKNPRSTVGTVTEIYDYLRILFTRIGIPYSPVTGLKIEKQSIDDMINKLHSLPEDTEVRILSSIVRGVKGKHTKLLATLKKSSFDEVRINNEFYPSSQLPELEFNKRHDIEVVVAKTKINYESTDIKPLVEKALSLSKRTAIILIDKLPKDAESDYKEGELMILSENFSCPLSKLNIIEMETRMFSFNSPYGACPSCNGLGVQLSFDPNLVVPNVNLSIKEGAIHPWKKGEVNSDLFKYNNQILECLANHFNFSLDTAWNQLDEKIQYMLLYGSGDEKIKFITDDEYRKNQKTEPFIGIICQMEKDLAKNENNWIGEELEKYQSKIKCRACNGYRVKKESLCIKIHDKNIGELCAMNLETCLKWIEDLPNHINDQHQLISEKILIEISKRIKLLVDVGLGYLTLSRESLSLSGGESQRIRLATQIGSGLSGIIYVLDEPSIGLHQCDNDRLIETMKKLRDIGNTVIVVEHDEDTMMAAEYIIDIGPEAGIKGGYIVAEGTPQDIINNPNSITGKYLSGEYFIQAKNNSSVNSDSKFISIKNAHNNNLKGINVDIPLNVFTSVTGVSGSGKSTLIIKTLYEYANNKLNNVKCNNLSCDEISGLEYLDKIIEIDQSPIGRTPRSNPATYTGAFSIIRDCFVSLKEAKKRKYKTGRFSFNVKGGRCEHCHGDGMIKIEMHFLPDVYIKCEECKGSRYNKDTLEIKYNGLNISEVLELTVDKAVKFFEDVPLVHEKLLSLKDVGLGYIKLGQSATTLSGGEAQRIKLARELSKKSTGRTLYILDEPTTGLHTHDVNKLLKVLHKLVDAGNSVLVIEHNLNVIKTSNWIIDIGPMGGEKGGELVASGTPEDISKNDRSITGRYLKQFFKED